MPQGELSSLVFVAYLIPNGKGEAIVCTGTVIAPRVVITAAHCLREPDVRFDISNFRVVAGVANWKDPSRQELRVDDTAEAPLHEILSGAGDVALLHLTSPAEVAPMRLAGRRFWSGDTSGVMAGWGRIHAQQKRATYLLHRARTLVRRPSWCRREFVPRRFICTSSTRRVRSSACYGDSGGPLLIRQPWDGRRVVSGILHGGFGCNRNHAINEYVPVFHFLRWIRNTEGRWSLGEEKGGAPFRRDSPPGS